MAPKRTSRRLDESLRFLRSTSANAARLRLEQLEQRAAPTSWLFAVGAPVMGLPYLAGEDEVASAPLGENSVLELEALLEGAVDEEMAQVAVEEASPVARHTRRSIYDGDLYLWSALAMPGAADHGAAALLAEVEDGDLDEASANGGTLFSPMVDAVYRATSAPRLLGNVPLLDVNEVGTLELALATGSFEAEPPTDPAVGRELEVLSNYWSEYSAARTVSNQLKAQSQATTTIDVLGEADGQGDDTGADEGEVVELAYQRAANDDAVSPQPRFDTLQTNYRVGQRVTFSEKAEFTPTLGSSPRRLGALLSPH